MNELLTSICSFLGSRGFGTVGVSLFAQSLPDSPYVCTSVLLNGGSNGPDSPVRERSIQILHRGTNIQTVSSVVNSIYSLFDDQAACWNVFDGFPGRMTADNEPGFFGFDVNNCPVYSLDLTFVSCR